MCGVVRNSPCLGQNHAAIDDRKTSLVARCEAGHCFEMNLNIFIYGVLALAVAYSIAKQFYSAQLMRKLIPDQLFSDVRQLFQNPEVQHGEAIGSHILNGAYEGGQFELKTITDTLATRKLPSLWLMITLKSPVPVKHTFDMMLRPAGPTSFSNFDFLPVSFATPFGFPAQAVLRSDAELPDFDLTVLQPHLDFFKNPRAKELLITPNGLRLVIQLAEAERSRYLVYRDARFNNATIDSDETKRALDILLALRRDLQEHLHHD